MLYVDQPIGVGFSYGTDPVTSTVTAAPYVWKLLQAFFAQFPQYESRDFGIFTESYGGHYGPGYIPPPPPIYNLTSLADPSRICIILRVPKRRHRKRHCNGAKPLPDRVRYKQRLVRPNPTIQSLRRLQLQQHLYTTHQRLATHLLLFHLHLVLSPLTPKMHFRNRQQLRVRKRGQHLLQRYRRSVVRGGRLRRL